MSSSSWEDREVLQEVWGGRVPAVFRLSEADQRPEQEAEPCCLLLPRMSYLPLATDKVRRHFAGAGDQQQVMWFSYRGTPLRSNIFQNYFLSRDYIYLDGIIPSDCCTTSCVAQEVASCPGM